MRAHFYGGPLDGKTLILPRDTHYWEVPLVDPIDWNATLSDKPTSMRRVTYECMTRYKVGEPTNLIHLEMPFVLRNG
jgi:hypothetical protein